MESRSRVKEASKGEELAIGKVSRERVVEVASVGVEFAKEHVSCTLFFVLDFLQ